MSGKKKSEGAAGSRKLEKSFSCLLLVTGKVCHFLAFCSHPLFQARSLPLLASCLPDDEAIFAVFVLPYSSPLLCSMYTMLLKSYRQDNGLHLAATGFATPPPHPPPPLHRL